MAIQRWACLVAISLFLGGCTAAQQDALFRYSVDYARGQIGFVEKQVALPEVTLSYLEKPGSGPTVVLVHGFSANKDTWLAFAAALPPDYHIIAPDLAGHGRSSEDAQNDYNLVRQTEHLHHLLQHLNLSSIHLVGNSMGGAISAFYAAQYPEQLRSVTLMDAAGLDGATPSEYFEALARGENPLIATDKDSFMSRWKFVMSKPPMLIWPFSSVMVRDAIRREPLNRKIFTDMMATREAFSEQQLADALRAHATMPALIMWGQEDRVLDVSAVAAFQQALPHAHVKIYEGIGHLPMVENAQLSAADLHEFIKSTH